MTTPEKLLRKKFFSKLIFGLGCFVVILAAWIYVLKGPQQNGIPWLLRKSHEWNERLSRTLFNPHHLAPTFDPSLARDPRVNGKIGMSDDPNFDPKLWRLEIEGNGKHFTLSLADLKHLPRYEMTTEFKCIEGWSTVTHWAGVRLADVIAKYDLLAPANRKTAYVGLSTPNKKYFVGIEIESALHPQTLLAYEMNGQELSLEHGAPLRLAIPLKYGIKNIKRIGHIVVGPERPADYWAQQGYDWYSGH